MSTGENFSLLHCLAKYVLYALLIFSPLVRGCVLPWQQTMVLLFTTVLVGILLIEKGISKRQIELPRTDLDKPILALLSLVAVSLLFTQSSPESWDSIVLLLSYIAIFYSTIHLIRSRSDQRELIYWILIVGVIVSCVGVLKYFGTEPAMWMYPDLSTNRAHMSASFGNHNHFAGYLEMIIPLLISMFLTRERRGVWRFILNCLVIFLVLCHILSLSRGGWFSLVSALTIMASILLFNKRFKRKKALLVAFTACVTVGLIVLAGSDLFERALSLKEEETVLSMGGRVQIWKGTLHMIQQYWLIGAGPGTFSTVFPHYQLPGTLSRFYFAHNDYLHFIAELGVGFVPILIWLIYAFVIKAAKKLKSDSRQIWGVTLGAMTGILAIGFHSFVDFNLHIPANAVLFAILAALVAGKTKPNTERS